MIKTKTEIMFSEDGETNVVVIDASSPSTRADNHRWPNSVLGEHSTHSGTGKSDSWKGRLHLMASRFQNRAIEFRSSWLLTEKMWKKLLEILLLSCVIIIVWMVFTVPTIVFTLTSANKNTTLDSDTAASTCRESQRVKYVGDVCSKELAQWQLCFFGIQDTSDIYIPALSDQQEIEATAGQLLCSFSLLDPSPECVAAFRPFLCLELFGLCDANNQLHQVTRMDCVRLTTDVCKREYDIAINFLELPSCDSFEDQDTQCLSDVSPTFSDQQTFDMEANVTCAEGFYLSNSSVCHPLCSTWAEPSEDEYNIIQRTITASVIIGLVSSIFFITIALTVYRNEIFSFPKQFSIYFCITLAFLYLILLIGVFNKEELFCSSNDFLESFANETPFCTFSGIIFIYGVLQAGCWVLILVLGIFWGIYFPFHYERFKASGRFKRVHITAVVAVVALPAVPALVLLRDGYHISQFAFCIGRSLNTIFYGVVLPFSFLSGVITTLMVLILWTVLKQLYILKMGLKNSRARKIGKAEAKLLFVTSAYILISSLLLVMITHVTVTRERDIQLINDYLLCQSTGLQPGKQCDETSRGLQSTPMDTLLNVAIVMEGLIPICALVFVAKCTCNCKFKKLRSFLFSSHST